MFLFHQRLAERVFTVLSLLFFTGAIAPFFSPTDLLYPVLFYIMPNIALAAAILLMVARWKRVIGIVVREQMLWVVMAVTLASMLWSDDPGVTLEHVIPLMRVTVFAVYFSTRYSLNEQLRLLVWTFGIAALFSLIVCVVLPSRGVMGVGFISSMEDVVHTGKWRGIFIHKTELGSMMSLSGMLFFFTTFNHPYRWIKWAGFFLSILLNLRSKTTGALLNLGIILALAPLYRALRWNYGIVVPFFIIISLVVGGTATILVSNAEAILTGLGKEMTISGRTEFWPILIDKISDRPWLGYGYRTFWVGGWEGNPADVWRTLREGFQPPHAHNGPLEILLDAGVVGASVFTLCWLVACLRAIVWIRQTKTTEGLLPSAYFTFMILLNLTESYLMRADIYWVIYVALILSMCNRKSNLAEYDALWQQQVKQGGMK